MLDLCALTQLTQGAKIEDILPFMHHVSEALLTSILDSCNSEKPLMTIAQMKDALKCATQLCRYSKRILEEEAVSQAWKPAKWSDLSRGLSESEYFKASVSLAKACQQISKLSESASSLQKQSSNNKAASATQVTEDQSKASLKRKQKTDRVELESNSRPEKTKRKKLRKIAKADSEDEQITV